MSVEQSVQPTSTIARERRVQPLLARVTIGVPVYNAESGLESALQELLDQSFGDYTIVISDNCSTDRTFDVCREFAERDERIRVLPQNPSNQEQTANFHRVLADAHTEYFMWAAYDDSRPPEYVERLTRALDANPDAFLACPTIVWVRPDGGLIDEEPFPDLEDASQIDAIRKLLGLRRQAGWAYGLFRTEALKRAFNGPFLRNGYLWAADLQMLLNLVLNGRITGTNETSFRETISMTSTSRYQPMGVLRNIHFSYRFLKEAYRSLWNARLTRRQKVRLAPTVLRFFTFRVLFLHPVLAWIKQKVTRRPRETR